MFYKDVFFPYAYTNGKYRIVFSYFMLMHICVGDVYLSYNAVNAFYMEVKNFTFKVSHFFNIILN